jgi:hypothetical protein
MTYADFQPDIQCRSANAGVWGPCLKPHGHGIGSNKRYDAQINGQTVSLAEKRKCLYDDADAGCSNRSDLDSHKQSGTKQYNEFKQAAARHSRHHRRKTT